MSWNATFPTPATRISQSVSQIQNNWGFLQTNISTDHYFNVGAPNEGHHKFVQMANLGGDPALSLDGVLYPKAGGGGSQLYYRDGTNIRQLVMYTVGQTVFAGAGVNQVLIPLVGIPNFMGIVMCSQNGASLIKAMAYMTWDGTNARVTSVVADGIVLGGVGTNVTLTTTSGMTVLWNYILAQ